MQMTLGEVGGLQNELTSSFSELSHLRALICTKKDGGEKKKKVWFLGLPAPPCAPKLRALFARSLSQGDFDMIGKKRKGPWKKQWPMNNADTPQFILTHYIKYPGAGTCTFACTLRSDKLKTLKKEKENKQNNPLMPQGHLEHLTSMQMFPQSMHYLFHLE